MRRRLPGRKNVFCCFSSETVLLKLKFNRHGKFIGKYDTTYFDTDDFNMYCMHQWKHTNRQKIRFRTYCISGLQFMEVKTKNNHKRTKKQRIKVHDMDLTDEEKRDFLGMHLHYDVDRLIPALNNHFVQKNSLPIWKAREQYKTVQKK